MSQADKPVNRLIKEKSPYLLQHAHNPVDWYSWTEEAFAKAQAENKPIFLSIGYSTCHWCHVMEKESFRDQGVADLLNQYFVAIKVDREERPDVDHLYMNFCQALTGSGGWPLTIIMTPEKKPFFAATYLPKNSFYGRQGLLSVLKQIGERWITDPTKMLNSAEEITESVLSAKPESEKVEYAAVATPFHYWANDALNNAYGQFLKTFDSVNGGFRKAPKFPSPHNLSFLLRYALSHPESEALSMVRLTLDKMGKGGVYDHIGFGFARYSTDDQWLVPHFEKMLYDNALLALAYLELYQFEHKAEDAQKAREIFSYVLRDMTSPEGAFYSAEDADSDGLEGKFYVWTPDEVSEALGVEMGSIYCRAYDITDDGNFEGYNIPNLLKSDLPALAAELGQSTEALAELLNTCREKLFNEREKRVHPHKDDKILTSWNGLMIAALAKGAQILGDSQYAQAAEKACSFILSTLKKDNRLLARYRDGEAAYLGYLDDYAFLVWGLIELYTATGNSDYLKQALELQSQQDELFRDPVDGGYFLTGSDGEELLKRPKETYDGAMPSGNSVSIQNLIRLARLTGDTQLEHWVEATVLAFRGELQSFPWGYTSFLQGIQFVLNPSQEIILSGSMSHPELLTMKSSILSQFNPYATVLYQDGRIGDIIPWVKNYPLESDKPKAYVCSNHVCLKPVETLAELEKALQKK